MKVIIGLGQTGLSVLRHFAAEECYAMDTRLHPPTIDEVKKTFPTVPLCLGSLQEEWLRAATEIIISPGLPLLSPALLPYRDKLIGDIECFAREAKAPIVAVTGSNGKTTVTTLIGRLLTAAGYTVQVGGNIGTPALDLLQKPVPDYYVLELSSFQLAVTSSLKTKTAVVLNVTPDHLDWHSSMEDYTAAKLRIYQHCEHPVVRSDATFPKPDHAITYTLQAPTTETLGIRDQFICLNGQPICSLSGFPFQGPYYLSNALAVLGLAYALQLPIDQMIPLLKEFKGLPHRCEQILECSGVVWYNDSKATNVDSTIAALNSVGARHRIILIAGGRAKTALSSLKESIERYVTCIIGLGEAAHAVEAISDRVPYVYAHDLPEAVRLAKARAVPGDAVLLSPACTSWDMFKNYEERGDQFKREVLCLNAL